MGCGCHAALMTQLTRGAAWAAVWCFSQPLSAPTRLTRAARRSDTPGAAPAEVGSGAAAESECGQTGPSRTVASSRAPTAASAGPK
eukprot:scaffold25099_cov90-Isochrysis_galbana.AAC.3